MQPPPREKSPRPKWGSPEAHQLIFDTLLDHLSDAERQYAWDIFDAAVERSFDIGEEITFHPNIPRWMTWNIAMETAFQQIQA
jgi:hypothetical protein